MKRSQVFIIMLILLATFLVTACNNTGTVSLPFTVSSRDSKIDMDIKVTFVSPDKYIIDFAIPNIVPGAKGTIYYGGEMINFDPTDKRTIVDITHPEEDNLQFTIYYSTLYDYKSYTK